MDRPIIFSAPMVRALLAGRKTQTRRVIKPQPQCEKPELITRGIRFAKGDRLWVRESFNPEVYELDGGDMPTEGPKLLYRADGYPYNGWIDPDTDERHDECPWTPATHMPRWASRLTLDVTDVRVERLQDITETDAEAEGAYQGKASKRFADDYAAMAIEGA